MPAIQRFLRPVFFAGSRTSRARMVSGQAGYKCCKTPTKNISYHTWQVTRQGTNVAKYLQKIYVMIETFALRMFLKLVLMTECLGP